MESQPESSLCSMPVQDLCTNVLHTVPELSDLLKPLPAGQLDTVDSPQSAIEMLSSGMHGRHPPTRQELFGDIKLAIRNSNAKWIADSISRALQLGYALSADFIKSAVMKVICIDSWEQVCEGPMPHEIGDHACDPPCKGTDVAETQRAAIAGAVSVAASAIGGDAGRLVAVQVANAIRAAHCAYDSQRLCYIRQCWPA